MPAEPALAPTPAVAALPPPPLAGPVSAALEREVREKLRTHGVVVWLDGDGSYTAFVDALAARARAGAFPDPVVPFRGSWLAWLLEVEGHGNRLDATPLLVHVPGGTPESVLTTPVLELYEQGCCYKKGFDTLVREAARGRVEPAEVDRFLAGPGATLDAADRWLEERAAAARGGLAAWLVEARPEEVLTRLVERDGRLIAIASSGDMLEALRAYWRRHTGIRFERPWADDPAPAAKGDDPLAGVRVALADAVGKWVLSVEYVHDLRRAPKLGSLVPLRQIAAPLVTQCRALAEMLRRTHPDRYVALADELEGDLAAEFEGALPEDLGDIDTFRAEEVCVLDGALAALREGRYAQATGWAARRTPDTSFWLARDRFRRFAWSLVGAAAALGELIAARGRILEGARTVEEAVERYAAEGATVDRADRRFEQTVEALLEPQLPHFGALQDVVHSLRRAHRDWADALARAFAAVCRERGFLPDPGIQQRTLYEDVVEPLVRGGERVALLVVDAFRYEMALELSEELAGGQVTIAIRPRLAELPTITAVGMNALAPVAKGGKLTLASAGGFTGFRLGEFVVKTPADRARAMGGLSLGRNAPIFDLSAVCAMDAKTLKREVEKSALIVVHGREIDDAGEAGVGLKTFEAQIRDLRAAVHHLERAGVTRCVLTADHGFLLADATTAVVRFGTARDPTRRYVLSDVPRAEAGLVPISLASLGYVGNAGYLLVREDTAIFDTGRGAPAFVHGGNSLAERVIPVLTVSRSRAAVAGTAALRLEAEALPDEQGFRALRVRLLPAPQPQGALGFASPAAVDVALRVPGRPDLRAIVKDAGDPPAINGRVSLPVDDAWRSILFSLEGERDERAQVEVFHPDGVERVEPCSPGAWFGVEGRNVLPLAGAGPDAPEAPPARKSPAKKKGAPPASAAPAEVPPTEAWGTAFEDASVARVFLHIGKHGTITEEEAVVLLGSPRALRRFSLAFEENVKRIPFQVRIETSASGKRYVREGAA